MATKNKIKIKPSKKGTFTRAAKKRGKGVQAFASQVLNNPEEYTPAMRRKANFARNAAKWKHEYGGEIPEYGLGGDIFGGATSGMAAGAAFGPIGAGIGAAVGGIAGLFGGKKREDAERKQRELEQKAQDRQMAFAQYDPSDQQQYATMFANGGIAPDRIPGQPYESVVTPIYKPVTRRTAYLEGKKEGLLPKDLKYSDFNKNQGQYIDLLTKGGQYKFNPKAVSGTRSGFTKRYQDVQEGVTGKPITREGQVAKFQDGGSVPKKVQFQDFSPFLMNQRVLDAEVERLEDPLEIVDSTPRKAPRVNAQDFTPFMKSQFVRDAEVERMERMGQEPVPGKVRAQDFTPFYQSQAVLDAEVENLEGMPEYAAGGMHMMPDGSMMPGAYHGAPNAELEGGESIVTPNGQDFNIEGPSHAQGGVPMALEGGTRVFSDQLKVPGTNNTFSDENKKLTKRIEKYEKTLNSKDSTPIARKTAERMLDKLEGKQNNLFMNQERLKINKGIPAEKGGNSFQDGGLIDPGADYAGLLAGLEGSNNLDGRTGVGRLLSSGVDALKGANFTGLASVAPAIYNIGQGLFGNVEQTAPDQYSNAVGMAEARRLKGRRYNVDPQLAATERAYAAAGRNLTNTARTRGEMLAGQAGLASRKAGDVSNIYAQKQNIENQYQSEAASMLAGLAGQDIQSRIAIDDRNRRAREARSNMFRAGLSQLGQAAQVRQRDINRARTDKLQYGALNPMFPSLEFNPEDPYNLFRYRG